MKLCHKQLLTMGHSSHGTITNIRTIILTTTEAADVNHQKKIYIYIYVCICMCTCAYMYICKSFEEMIADFFVLTGSSVTTASSSDVFCDMGSPLRQTLLSVLGFRVYRSCDLKMARLGLFWSDSVLPVKPSTLNRTRCTYVCMSAFVSMRNSVLIAVIAMSICVH